MLSNITSSIHIIHRVHQSWLIVGLATGIIIGAVLAMVLKVNYLISPVWIIAVSITFVLAYLRPNSIFIIIMVFAGMLLIFVRTTSELTDLDYIKQLSGETIIISGTIEGDPETDEKGTNLKLTNLTFGQQHKKEGKIYTTIAKNEYLARGDQIILNGKLSDGFGTYAGYMYKPQLINWKRPDPANPILEIRNKFATRISQLIPDKEVALGLSYLLGMRTNLTTELDENLRTVGLIHIVVASGAHLSILVEITRKIFGKISRFTGALFSMILIIAFMSMVGFTPSILRAGIMAILTIITWYCGRTMAPWRLIIIVAAITLIIEPNFILNLGWLMSFASYSGIMIIAPRLNRFFYGTRKPGLVGNILIMTISATLMTLPITLYYYGTMSLISVVANLLILPTLPWAMGLIFATGVIAKIPGIGFFISFLATKLLDYHITVVEFFASRKEFIIKINPYQPWVLGGYIMVISILVIGLVRQKMVKLKEIRLLNKF